jgi:hypothetical protein
MCAARPPDESSYLRVNLLKLFDHLEVGSSILHFCIVWNSPAPSNMMNTTLYYALYLVPFLLVTIFLVFRNHWPQPWKSSYPDFDETFRRLLATDNFWGRNPEIQLLLSKMLSCFRKKSDSHGVVVSFEKSKFQMIQFDAEASPVLFKGVPMIPVKKWGHCTKRETALIFLESNKKDEKIENISCSTEDIFRAVFEHLAATCRSSGEIDSKTGCQVYRGHLSPQKV